MFVTLSRKYYSTNINKFWYGDIFDHGEADKLVFVSKILPGDVKNDNLEKNRVKMHYLHKITVNTCFKTYAEFKIEFKFKKL